MIANSTGDRPRWADVPIESDLELAGMEDEDVEVSVVACAC